MNKARTFQMDLLKKQDVELGKIDAASSRDNSATTVRIACSGVKGGMTTTASPVVGRKYAMTSLLSDAGVPRMTSHFRRLASDRVVLIKHC